MSGTKWRMGTRGGQQRKRTVGREEKRLSVWSGEWVRTRHEVRDWEECRGRKMKMWTEDGWEPC